MDILYYHEYRKFWDATDATKAFLALFNYLNKELKVYEDLSQFERGLYKKAKAGDGDAAYRLCNHRQDYEYEGWSIEEVEEP